MKVYLNQINTDYGDDKSNSEASDIHLRADEGESTGPSAVHGD